MSTVIVEPDFLEHWKTRLLVDRTKDEAAPLMLLRLWGHCQTRKRWAFKDMTGEVLAVICRSKLDGPQLLNVLNECGFIEMNGQMVVVHDWEDTNRLLVSAWKNGLKGGRPIKTDRKPTGNRSANRSGTDPSNLSYLSKSTCTKEEAEQYCTSLGLPASDGTAMFLHWEEKGWAKVKDWKLTIQKWKSFGYLPSQKQKKSWEEKKPDPNQSRLDREYAEAQQRKAERKRANQGAND